MGTKYFSGEIKLILRNNTVLIEYKTARHIYFYIGRRPHENWPLELSVERCVGVSPVCKCFDFTQ